jgi:GT2 family glycosyltransferase
MLLHCDPLRCEYGRPRRAECVSDMNDISVVVGTYNRRDLIQACVESVLAQTKRLARLYITDAGSTDGTIDYLNSVASGRVVPVLEGKKLGQARAYNDVFKQVTSRYVCWISDDNAIVNGGLDVAAEILDREARVGMVGLKVKDLQGPFVKAPYIGGVSALGVLNVNQGMLRTEVLSEAGYFSERFRDYGIDPDLTAKVLLSGHDVVYTKDIAIHHHRLWETDPSKPEYEKMMQRQVVAQQLYLDKYGKAMGAAPFYLAKRAGWKALREALGKRYSINSHERFMGQLPRDWNNIFASRYISVFDPLLHQGKAFHLRQNAPLLRPRVLPADPTPLAASA